MTGTTRSSDGLDERRKRLLFRCWHRGTREMDLILGRFADAEIASLSDDELSQLEHLIDVPDQDLYAAVSGQAALPAEYATGLFDRIRSFRSGIRRMKAPARSPAELLAPGRPLTFANVAEGAEGLVVSDLARAVAARPKRPAVSLAVVCRDGPRMQQLARALEFFAPDLPVLQFPAWDCQPYDRVSPHGGILAQRMTTLARLSRLAGSEKPLIVLTTVNAIVQRVPARETVAAQALSVAPGHVVPMDSIVAWLEHNGYGRSSTVREPGEYAVRGGILDLFPAGLDQPVRFDFFGDSLESIRSFDAETQRTLLDMRSLDLVPISEFQLVTETIRRFRMGYVAAFGAPERDDPLYEAVSEGRRHPGMEHWLPLFHERMDTLFDYLDARRLRSSRKARTLHASASSRSPIITTRGARRWSIPAAARPTSRCRPTGYTSAKTNGAGGWRRPRWRG